MESVLQSSQCSFYAPLLHVLRFPFSPFITQRSLYTYLLYCSLLTTLLHFFHLLMLCYDPDTTLSFCNSNTQLQFEPKPLLQPNNSTLLVNLTSGYAYGPIKIPSPKSSSMIHAVRLLLATSLPPTRAQPVRHYISESLLTDTNKFRRGEGRKRKKERKKKNLIYLPIYLTTYLTVHVTEHQKTI